MERKMKFLSAVMKLYLIIWTITPALGLYEKCNRSLGLPELDIEKIDVYTEDDRTWNSRGNIRLSDDWPVLRIPTVTKVFFTVDLGKIYNITGMIIKGEEGNGTAALDTFSFLYSNDSDFGNMTFYRNEKGKIQEISGTTKEENIRYEPFYPSFVARYFMIRTVKKVDSLFGYVAIQIDVLGCNITQEKIAIPTTFTTESTTTATPCNDILNTRGLIIKEDDKKSLRRCGNPNRLQIIFDENGMYEITKVKITITNDTLFDKIKWDRDYAIIFIDVFGEERKCRGHKYDGNSITLFCWKTKHIVLKSLKICLNSDEFTDKERISIYNYAIVEIRGCPNGSEESD